MQVLLTKRQEQNRTGNIRKDQGVPFNASSLCNLGHDTLRKPRGKIGWVSATLHDCLKVLLAQIASDQKFYRLLGRMLGCCFSISQLTDQLTDFLSKGRITDNFIYIYFFDVKDLMYICKQSDQMLFRRTTLPGFFLCNVVQSLWDNIAQHFSCALLSQEY